MLRIWQRSSEADVLLKAIQTCQHVWPALTAHGFHSQLNVWMLSTIVWYDWSPNCQWNVVPLSACGPSFFRAIIMQTLRCDPAALFSHHSCAQTVPWRLIFKSKQTLTADKCLPISTICYSKHTHTHHNIVIHRLHNSLDKLSYLILPRHVGVTALIEISISSHSPMTLCVARLKYPNSCLTTHLKGAVYPRSHNLEIRIEAGPFRLEPSLCILSWDL